MKLAQVTPTHTVLVTLGSINNRSVCTLNDSGVDVSVMGEQCARRLQLNVKREGNLPTFRNPNGDGLHCVGVVEMTVFMSCRCYGNPIKGTPSIP